MAHAIQPATLNIPITITAPFIPVIVNEGDRGLGASNLKRRVVLVPFVGDQNEATGTADLTGIFSDDEVYSIQALYHNTVPVGSVLTISSPDALTNAGTILSIAGNTDYRYHPRQPANKAADGTVITDGHQPIIVSEGATITCSLVMTGGIEGSPAAIDLDTGVALVFMFKALH